jgi:Family of unknown function (DUF6152)
MSAAIMTALMLAASNATAHHSFAPHFDTSRRVNISGTVKRYEARNPHSYLHIDAVDENGRTREYVCESHGVTQLTRIGITPQLFKPGTKLTVTGPASRHSPYMCFFEIIEWADGRTMNGERPGRIAANASAVETVATPGRVRNVVACAAPEPRRRRSATAYAIADAGRRKGHRVLRPVQGRSRVPMRSGCRAACLAGAEHAVRDFARRCGCRTPSRVDGCPAGHSHEHEDPPQRWPEEFARSFDRPLGGRHVGHRDRKLFSRRSGTICRATRSADKGVAAFGVPHND